MSNAQLMAQLMFLLTGPPMVLLTQYETYMGGNSTWSFCSAVAQYSAMTLFAVIPLAIDAIRNRNQSAARKPKPLLRLSRWKLRYILPIALFDVLDVWAASYAYTSAGAALFIVLYSSVTIFTGLIRRCYLQKTLSHLQWTAVVIITVGVAVTAADTQIRAFDFTLLLGICASLLSALMDALMYVCAERALSQRNAAHERISEWDIMTGVGVLGSVVSLLYVVSYVAAGEWDNFVDDHRRNSYLRIALFWSLEGIAVAAHYVGFFYVVSLSSSVSAAVNKAVQSIVCLLCASVVFCEQHHKQCVSWTVATAAVLVNFGTVLYSIGHVGESRDTQSENKTGNVDLLKVP